MAPQQLQSLTEKEKQTLRLLVVGYDAKSMARHLGLSVHTINERLRDARRKLATSSSREAARLLREAEQLAPQLLADKDLGDAPDRPAPHNPPSTPRPAASRRWVWLIGGTIMLSMILAAFAMSAGPAAAPATATVSAPALQSDAAKTALDFLNLIDAARWDDGYRATGSEFQRLNTVATWAQVSQTVRAPLGAVLSREIVSDDSIPSSQGYWFVKFRTNFANKSGTIETVTLIRESGSWKISGITID